MKRDKKGFTLVEIVVVLAIMAILAVLIGGSLFAYTKNSKYRKNNDFARSVYVAAQNALSQKKVNGTLEEWFMSADVQGAVVELGPAGKAPGTVDPAVSPDGQEDWLKKNFDLVYSDSMDGLTELEKESMEVLQKRSKIYALTMSTGDKTSQLWKLLEDYMPDGMDEGKNGTACVEFNPVTGQVYAAFYSDRSTSFSYGSGALEESGMADPGRKVLRGSDETKREELMIGYYNVWQIGEPELPEKEESSLQYTLVNGRLRDGAGHLTKAASSDSLYLKVKLQMLPAEDTAVTYRLTFCNKAGVAFDALDSTVLSEAVKKDMVSELLFTVKRKPSPAPAEDPYEYSGCAYVAKADASGFTRYPLSMQFVPGHPEEFNIMLDAVDLYATTDQITAGTGAASLEKLRNTYSVSRFGIPSQDISVKLAEADHGMAGVEASNAESLYFAQEEKDGLNWEIQLADMRHLYNLRFVSTPDTDLPEALRENYQQYFQTNGATAFVQTENLDWKKSVEEKHVFRGAASSSIPDADESTKDETGVPVSGLPAAVTVAGTAADQASFPAVPFLPWSEASGGGLKTGNGIYDAGYSASAKRAAYKISNLVIAETAADQPAGLFRNVLGQVKNLWLEDVTVEGVSNVGAVAGRNFGILGQDAGLTVPETEGSGEGAGGAAAPGAGDGSILVTGKVTGTGTAVGGIAGSDGLSAGGSAEMPPGSASMNRSQYHHVTASVVLKRQGAAAAEGARAGGIVGSVYGGTAGTDRKITMTDCRFVDSIIAGTGSAAARQQAAQLISDGDFNGGLAGYVAKGAGIEAVNCLYAGNLGFGNLEEAEQATYLQGSYTGGLFGYCDGQLKLENCRVSGQMAETGLSVENRAYVTGKNCVGGILGKLGRQGRVEIQNKEITVGGATEWVYGVQVGVAAVQGKNFVGGFAGVNTAEGLFDTSGSLKFLEGMKGVEPERIKGDSFVGGIFGGSVLQAQKSAVLGKTEGVELFAGGTTELNASGCCAGAFSGLWAAGTAASEKSEQQFLDAVAGTDVADTAALQAKLEELFAGWTGTGSPYTFSGITCGMKQLVGAGYVGGIAGYTTQGSNLTFDNCANEKEEVVAGRWILVNGEPKVEVGGAYAGGLVSVNYGKIKNCTNQGSVYGDSQVGGLAGSNGMQTAAGAARIENSRNLGEVCGNRENIGGIAGRQSGENSSVQTCVNSGSVSFLEGPAEGGKEEPTLQNMGGIVGLCESGTLQDVKVELSEGTGCVRISGDQVTGTGRLYQNIGGIVGKYRGKGLKTVSVKADVLAPGGRNVGGVIGLADGVLESDYQAGELPCSVKGYEQTGGIIGRLGSEATWASTRGTLQVLEGMTVTGRYADVGGVIGYVQGQAQGNGKPETLPAISMKTQANVNGSAVNMGGVIGHITYSGTLQVKDGRQWVYAGNVTAGDADNAAENAYSYIQARDESSDRFGPGCVGGIVGLAEGTGDADGAMQLDLENKDSWQANSGLTVYNASCVGSYIGRYRGIGALTHIQGGNRIEAKYNGWMSNLPTGDDGYVQGYVGGLFGCVGTAEVKGCSYVGDSCVINAAVDGGSDSYVRFIGGLTGANGRPISDSKNEGTISLQYQGDKGAYAGYIGGISGKSWADGQISGCTVDKPVDGGSRGTYVGGVCGENLAPLDCSNALDGKVYGYQYVGGLTGANRSLIEDTADHTKDMLWVSGRQELGGIAGYNGENGTITVQNLPQTSVTGDIALGGVAGHNSGVIRRFSAPENNGSQPEAVYTVNGMEQLGGLAGVNSGTISPSGKSAQDPADMVDTAQGKAYITWSPKVVLQGRDAEHKVYSAGGIVGLNRGTLLNLNFEGQENTADSAGAKLPLQGTDNLGGIASYTEAGSKIINCANNAALQLLQLHPEGSGQAVKAGGIVGSANGNGEITDCVSAGTFVFPASYVTDAASGAYSQATTDTVHAAGILGDHVSATETVTITRCRNYSTAFLEENGVQTADREVLRGLYCAPILGSAGKVVFTDSFDLADLSYPVSDLTFTDRISGSAYFFDHDAPQAINDHDPVVEVENTKDTTGWNNTVINSAKNWDAHNNNYQEQDLKILLRKFDKPAQETRNDTVYYRANYSYKSESGFEWFYDKDHPALAVNGSFKPEEDGTTKLSLYYGKASWSEERLAKPMVRVLLQDGTVQDVNSVSEIKQSLNNTILYDDSGTADDTGASFAVDIYCAEYELKGAIKQIWLIPGTYQQNWGNGNVVGMAIYAIDVSGEFNPAEVEPYYRGFHADERQDPADNKSYYVYLEKDDAKVYLTDGSTALFAAAQTYPGKGSWGYDKANKIWKKPARGNGSTGSGLYELFEGGLAGLLQNPVPNSANKVARMRFGADTYIIPQPELKLQRLAGGLQMQLMNADLYEALELGEWYVHAGITLEDGTEEEEALLSKDLAETWFDLTDYSGDLVTVSVYLEVDGSAATQKIHYNVLLSELPESDSVSGNGVSGNGVSGNGVSGNGVSGNGVSGNTTPDQTVSGNDGPDTGEAEPPQFSELEEVEEIVMEGVTFEGIQDHSAEAGGV